MNIFDFPCLPPWFLSAQSHLLRPLSVCCKIPCHSAIWQLHEVGCGPLAQIEQSKYDLKQSLDSQCSVFFVCLMWRCFPTYNLKRPNIEVWTPDNSPPVYFIHMALEKLCLWRTGILQIFRKLKARNPMTLMIYSPVTWGTPILLKGSLKEIQAVFGFFRVPIARTLFRLLTRLHLVSDCA